MGRFVTTKVVAASGFASSETRMAVARGDLSKESAMTINHYSRFALTFALALITPSLFAGEIVPFDGENFQGRSVVFNDTVPNLADTGFNDQTASIRVRDGTWEVCFDANFRGACMRLPPGDYARIDPPFNRSISSLRQVAGAESSGNYSAATEITLFDGENFQGNRIAFHDTVPNLADT